MTFSRSLRGLLAAACGALSLAATADPVVYNFTGQVDHDEADRGYQGFAGSFSFDSAATNNINDPSGSMGNYTGTGPAWAMSLSFDGGALLDFSSEGFHVNVTNGLGGYDWLGLLGMGSAGTVSAGLYDFTAALFGDAGLPLREGGYTLADFGWSDFSWEAASLTLQGRFTSLSCTAGCATGGGNPGGGGDPGDPGNPGGGGDNPEGGGTPPPNTVPEPGSLVLAVTSLALLLRRRRG
ncbi:MAG: MYXO-CTERM sorting domain-containing protein [Roseateles sp.]|uniref:MYXO-CTERM sorting domain-containing protein n=1 Tax=Roseateles sp. TaxID=1971397 RepID=UPI0039E74725